MEVVFFSRLWFLVVVNEDCGFGKEKAKVVVFSVQICSDAPSNHQSLNMGIASIANIKFTKLPNILTVV